MKIKRRREPCPSCNGSGKVSRVTGQELRRAREAAGLSLRQLCGMAEPVLSPAYLSDVELGRRNATERVIQLYERLP